LQQDFDRLNFVEALVKKGVPRTDIILGLQAPYKRSYTDYGVV
ncbi:MAG: element excision factor XisI family protein, partial [Microcystaceae cyanobacterium]